MSTRPNSSTPSSVVGGMDKTGVCGVERVTTNGGHVNGGGKASKELTPLDLTSAGFHSKTNNYGAPTTGNDTPNSGPMSPTASISPPPMSPTGKSSTPKSPSCMSPTPMSPGITADAGRNIAVDYMKSRYDKISTDKRPEITKVPQIMRQPKKLDGEWDKMIDEKAKRLETQEPCLKEQDILAMVMACAGIDTKSQYLSLMAEKEAKDTPVNRQPVEKVAPPEITKTVRNMFESGNIADLHNPQKRLQTYEMTPGSGVFENEPTLIEGVVRSGEQCSDDDVAAVQRGLTKSLLSQWQTMGGTGGGKGDGATKDDVLEGENILKGTTKSLLSQWTTKASGDSTSGSSAAAGRLGEKKPIKIHATDGTVCESRPTKRSDVIREDDVIDTEADKVQAGTTKSLLSQWKTKGTEEFKSERRPIINIAEGDGKVVESTPTRRSDVIREDDVIDSDTAAVQRGTTKSLLSQWKTKGKEEFRMERRAIKIYEDDGTVAENEPTRCTDVVNAVEGQTADERPPVEAGFTRSLVSQWKTKNDAPVVSSRHVINIAEDEGSVRESIPVQRTDVVREDYVDDKSVLQRGITKNLLGHWQTVSDQEFKKERAPIVLTEGEGTVAENQPVVRNDVVREYDAADDVAVQQGLTRSLLSQWKTKGNEEFRVERKPINIAEGEGKVAENEPVRRNDVVSENTASDDAILEGKITRDLTKTLRSQWLAKGQEEYRKERSPIVIMEGEGTVAENDPVQRTDVTREYNESGEPQVQRGTTRTLLSQWSNKASAEVSRERTPIVLAEGDDVVSENQPVVRSDVYREDYDPLGEQNRIQRGTTSNLKSQWMSKSTAEYKKEKTPIKVAEGEGVVAENEPKVRTDVVHEYDDYAAAEAEQAQRGMTKQLLSQWRVKGTEEFKADRKTIVIAADEGNVSENNPVQRQDVVRENDSVTEGELIQRGLTKNLTSQWKTKGSEEFRIERAPINLMECEGKVAENEPVKRTDVMREDYSYGEEHIQQGLAKSLANQWQIKGSEEFCIERPPVNLFEGKGTVAENEPAKRSDVVREDASYGEEQIQRGMAKSLATQWKSKGSETFQVERSPINIMEGEGSVSENTPVQRSDVIRGDDIGSDDVNIQRGFTKSLTSQWKIKGSEEFHIERAPIVLAEGDGNGAENEPIQRTDVVREDCSYGEERIQKGLTQSLRSQWNNKGSEEFKIERAPINIAEGEGKVAENEPVRRNDVVREDASYGEECIQKGLAKSLTSQWRNKGTEEFHIERAPINIAESEGKVSENEPIRRSDLVRADENKCEEQVQKGLTKNLTSQWKTKGTEEFQINRPPINLLEGEGNVSENEPMRRSDVVHADDYAQEEQIQRGLTKNLTSQWKTKGMEEFQINRPPINVLEGEGKVAENEPVRRNDVYREDASYGEETIQRGIAKNLATQWKTKGNEEFKLERSPINICEGEGKVSENDPIQRTDVVHADDASYGEDIIQRGFTQSLRSQWKNKGSEEFRIERAPINIAEGEGKVSENEPVQRSDVFREDASYGEEQIQKGLAKSLTTQWKTKGSEEYHIERPPINIAEGEGKVSENEPTRRNDVVREDASYGEEQIQCGLAKTLTSQWKNKSSEKFSIERPPIQIAEGEGSVSENAPIRRTDVVREEDSLASEERIQRGFTKNLTTQWKAKGTEEFHVERSPINIAEGEGKICENEPMRRSDVLREDADYGEERIERGMAKNLASQWRMKGTEQFHLERSPINIAEGEGTVAENEPTHRTDVVREDANYGEERIQKGLAKNLASQWRAKGTEEFRIERSPINIAEGEGKVSENEPVRRTDVVREYDQDGGDTVQRGITSNLLTQWKNKGMEEFRPERSPIVIAEGEGQIVENNPVHRSDAIREEDNTEDIWLKKGFTKDLAGFWLAPNAGMEFRAGRPAPIDIKRDGQGVVAENEPVRREGVFREHDQMEEVMGQRGLIQNLTGRFKNAEQDANALRARKEQIVMDFAEGPSVLENEPMQVSADVVRCDSYTPDMLEAGVTKNLVQRWKTGEVESVSPRNTHPTGQSAFMAEIEQAQGSGVFENDPQVRTDVIRETDYAPEMIPIKQTRNTRKLWTRREQEEGMDILPDRPSQLVRFTPPRELTPPQEDFKSYQTITLSSGGNTPAVGGDGPRGWSSPSSPPSDPNPRGGSTQLQLLPSASGSSGSAPDGRHRQQQQQQQQKLQQQQQQQLLQQKLEQQLLHQQQVYQQHQLLAAQQAQRQQEQQLLLEHKQESEYHRRHQDNEVQQQIEHSEDHSQLQQLQQLPQLPQQQSHEEGHRQQQLLQQQQQPQQRRQRQPQQQVQPQQSYEQQQQLHQQQELYQQQQQQLYEQQLYNQQQQLYNHQQQQRLHEGGQMQQHLPFDSGTIASPSEEKTLRSSATLVLNLKPS